MTVRKALIGVDFATEREQRETNTQKARNCRNMTDNDETLHNFKKKKSFFN